MRPRPMGHLTVTRCLDLERVAVTSQDGVKSKGAVTHPSPFSHTPRLHTHISAPPFPNHGSLGTVKFWPVSHCLREQSPGPPTPETEFGSN